jgi:hypothetical protein
MEATEWKDDLPHYLEERMMHLEEKMDLLSQGGESTTVPYSRLKELERLAKHFNIQLQGR